MTQSELVTKLAQQCLKRLDFHQLKGKKRNEAAIDYFCGAAQALTEIGSEFNLVNAAFLVSTRGAEEVEKLAKREDAPTLIEQHLADAESTGTGLLRIEKDDRLPMIIRHAAGDVIIQAESLNLDVGYRRIQALLNQKGDPRRVATMLMHMAERFPSHEQRRSYVSSSDAIAALTPPSSVSAITADALAMLCGTQVRVVRPIPSDIAGEEPLPVGAIGMVTRVLSPMPAHEVDMVIDVDGARWGVNHRDVERAS